MECVWVFSNPILHKAQHYLYVHPGHQLYIAYWQVCINKLSQLCSKQHEERNQHLQCVQDQLACVGTSRWVLGRMLLLCFHASFFFPLTPLKMPTLILPMVKRFNSNSPELKRKPVFKILNISAPLYTDTVYQYYVLVALLCPCNLYSSFFSITPAPFYVSNNSSSMCFFVFVLLDWSFFPFISCFLTIS